MSRASQMHLGSRHLNEILKNIVIGHRKVAEDAKKTDIFLSAERAERKIYALNILIQKLDNGYQ